MIANIIGGICLFFAACAFIGAYNSVGISADTSSRDFCLLIIAAAICFK